MGRISSQDDRSYTFIEQALALIKEQVDTVLKKYIDQYDGLVTRESEWDKKRSENDKKWGFAEDARVEAEAARKKAEDARIAAETARIAAEAERASATSKAMTDMDTQLTAAKAATTAAETVKAGFDVSVKDAEAKAKEANTEATKALAQAQAVQAQLPTMDAVSEVVNEAILNSNHLSWKYVDKIPDAADAVENTIYIDVKTGAMWGYDEESEEMKHLDDASVHLEDYITKKATESAIDAAKKSLQTRTYKTPIAVAPSAWATDSTPKNSDYPYRTTIVNANITANDACEVSIDSESYNSGIIYGDNESIDGGIYMWASEIPTFTVTITQIDARPEVVYG